MRKPTKPSRPYKDFKEYLNANSRLSKPWEINCPSCGDKGICRVGSDIVVNNTLVCGMCKGKGRLDISDMKDEYDDEIALYKQLKEEYNKKISIYKSIKSKLSSKEKAFLGIL